MASVRSEISELTKKVDAVNQSEIAVVSIEDKIEYDADTGEPVAGCSSDPVDESAVDPDGNKWNTVSRKKKWGD